jgi:hypothetical protein
MPNASEIRVHGLREMSRAFAKADKNLKKDLTRRLKKVAEPVRAEAARRALHEVRNIRPPWSDMRTGVTTSVVYIAPRERGRRSALRRPNLAGLLMDRAMQPALDAHSGEIETELGRMLDEIGKDWSHGG